MANCEGKKVLVSSDRRLANNRNIKVLEVAQVQLQLLVKYIITLLQIT